MESKLASRAARIKALARKHGKDAIKTLAEIMNQADGPATARVSAALALLDRGWGKAAQPLAGEYERVPLLARIERVIVDTQAGNGGQKNRDGEEARTGAED